MNIHGVEREIDPEIAEKFAKICEISYTGEADMIVSLIEDLTKNYEFDTYCDHCGCKLAKNLGDLEFHTSDCPNMPF